MSTKCRKVCSTCRTSPMRSKARGVRPTVMTTEPSGGFMDVSGRRISCVEVYIGGIAGASVAMRRAP